MSLSTEYLDRLRNIREKYGCSQNKSTSALYPEQYIGVSKSPTKSYQKSDMYALEKKKYGEPISMVAGSPAVAKALDYAPRPQSSIGLSSQPYTGMTGMVDYSKRMEREK